MKQIINPLRKAFTLIEMIIVMVVLGIIANFGVEILVNAYSNYIFTSVQNRLQSQSEAAVNQIGNRLEYRIKESTIARTATGAAHVPLATAPAGMNARVLEWVSIDREGWLGSTNIPLWSGFIDVNNPSGNANRLITPQSDLATLNTLIGNIAPSGSGVADAAIYFLGGSGDTTNGFGWSGAALGTQNQLLHPINPTADGNFTSSIAGVNFAGVDIFEFYQLTWTAYAVSFENADADGRGELVLYYDYQPWLGESIAAASREVLMQNVTTFAFKAEGDVVSVQVCVSDEGLSDTNAYSVCKEKTIL